MKEIQDNKYKLMAKLTLMEKRFRYVALQLLVMLLSTVIIPSSALAISYADYPYSQPAGSYYEDAWNFYQCECTSYVAWCLNNRNGIRFHNLRKPGSNASLPTSIAAQYSNSSWYYGRWGNANNWKNAAEKLGYTVNTTPAVGAVYWTWNGSISSSGHVAWVSEVNGNQVTIEQYNAGWVVIDGEYHGNHKFSSETFTAGTKGEKYIHIKDINPEERGSYMEKGNTNRELPDGDYMIAAAGDPAYYLDIAGGDSPAQEGTNVQLWSLGDTDTWKIRYLVGDCDAWTIKYNKYDNDGFYTISQYKQSQCLDVSGADTLNGKNVQVWGDNQGRAQQWAITKNWIQDGPGKGYRLEARCSDYSLDISGGTLSRETNVRQWKDNMSDAQKWLFIPYKPSQTLSKGRYILLADADTSYELDVDGDTGNVKNGANVQLWSDAADSRYNSFDSIPLNNGYYELIHVASGKALDVSGASTESAANIHLWDYNGGIAQQWAITPQRDGFMLRARCSGYAMDLEDGKLQNGQNVRQLFYNGAKAQTWKFVQAEYRVVYDAVEGTGAPEEQTKYYKSTLYLSDVVPTRKGYRFVGWQDILQANGTMYYPGQAYTKDSGLILYAVWERADNAIVYDANGGVNPPSNRTKEPEEAVSLSMDIPTRTGYTFMGWARSASATVPEFQPGDTYSDDADLTLYAVWKITNPPTLTGSNFNLLMGDSRSWRDFVTLSHDGMLSYTLQASASGSAIALNGDQVTAKALGTGTITVKVVEYPAASCTLSVNVVDLSTMLKLPAALTAIEAEAFENSGIIAVTVPSKCVSIGNKAFANNHGLVYAYIPKSVTTIAADAFVGCPNLIIYCYNDTDAYYYAKSKNIKYQLLSDEWALANEVPLGATITNEKWTYKKTVTETTTSTETLLSGWTRGDYTWEKTKDGSYDFAVFPDGFDTGHSLYRKYAVPSVPAETDRRLGSTTQKSYIYWHWCFIDACAASDTDHNVLVEDARRTNVNISGSVYRDFIYFDAFESTTNYGTVGPGRNGDIDVAPMRYAWRGVLDDASQWWWRFEIQSQSYTDYHKLYSYSRTVTTEESSSAAVVEGNGISNVQHWVKYSY